MGWVRQAQAGGPWSQGPADQPTAPFRAAEHAPADTEAEVRKLRVDLEDFENNTAFAKYDFSISPNAVSAGGDCHTLTCQALRTQGQVHSPFVWGWGGKGAWPKHRHSVRAQGPPGRPLLSQLPCAPPSARRPLTYHSGQKFSTFDRDQDLFVQNCAVFPGAFWFRSCHFANLNGFYLGGSPPLLRQWHQLGPVEGLLLLGQATR